MPSKLKFCFLELSGISCSNIFNPQLVESMDLEPKNMESTIDSFMIIKNIGGRKA